MKRIEELEQRIKLSNEMLNFNYILDKFKRNRLLISNEPITLKNFITFKEIVKIFQRVYPNSWDIVFNLTENYENFDRFDTKINIKGIRIHFPEVTLTNFTGATHTIKDLFVKVCFNINGFNELTICDISGTRTTYYKEEKTCNYTHSHLPTIAIESDFQEENFCTGSGEISLILTKIRNTTNLNLQEVFSLALMIRTLVSWESIEGTPYREFRSMYRNDFNNPYTIPSEYFISNNLYPSFYSKLVDKLKLKFNFTNTGVRLLDEEKSLIPHIIELAKDKRNLSDNFLCVKKDTYPYYFIYKNDLYKNFINNKESMEPCVEEFKRFKNVIFRGREFHLKILYNHLLPNNKDIEITVHPEVLKTLKNIIENETTKEIFDSFRNE